MTIKHTPLALIVAESPQNFLAPFLKFGASDQRKLRHRLIKNSQKIADLQRKAGDGF